MQTSILLSAIALVLVPLSVSARDAKPDPAEVRVALQEAIDHRIIPGAALWMEHQGAHANLAMGSLAILPKQEPIPDNALFDLASLTKVCATAPGIMLLIEQGRIRPDEPVMSYLPEFHGGGRDRITVRHLLTHTSGLKPSLPREPAWAGYEKGIDLACHSVPDHSPDEQFRYSDINFILLGEIVHRVSGEMLDVFVRKHLHEPLGMKDTLFLPPAPLRLRIAPTEKDEKGNWLRGVVHDPTSRRMGGVAGHAGLFSTAADIARYCRMILNGGEIDGVRVFKAETLKLMTTVSTPSAMVEKRALGWDVDTRYSKPRGGFPVGASFGHTGFTGTCLWIDPQSQSFFVFLSSHLHGTDPKSDVRKLYEQLGGIVSAELLGSAQSH